MGCGYRNESGYENGICVMLCCLAMRMESGYENGICVMLCCLGMRMESGYEMLSGYKNGVWE